MNSYSQTISDSISLRSATTADISAISVILKMSVARMLAEGKKQWDEDYPNETHVHADIDNGVGYVLESNGEILGYAAVIFTGEPAYTRLNGKWLTEDDYVVVHRLAISQNVRESGMGTVFMNAIEDYARRLGIKSFKIDTNFDNFAMLGLLKKLGFVYCGDIEYPRGSRMAFEKTI